MNSEQLAVILKSFDAPDEVRVMEKGKFELVHLGGKSSRRFAFRDDYIHHAIQRHVARLDSPSILRLLFPDLDAGRFRRVRERQQRGDIVSTRHARKRHSCIRAVPQAQLRELLADRVQSSIHRIKVLHLLR